MFTVPTSRAFLVTNDILAFATIISIAGIVLGTVPALDAYGSVFLWVEYITVSIFTVEYVLRVIAAPSARRYVVSFFGIVDLLAIIPTFLGLANLTFLKSARVLRILRFLRMLRLAKLMRLHPDTADEFEEYRSVFRLNLQIYFFSLFAAIVIFGSLIYVFEGGQDAFGSIPQGMLWATQAILGGIPGNAVGENPATLAGTIVTFFARFTGLALFGLLIAVIGSALKQFLFGSRKLRTE